MMMRKIVVLIVLTALLPVLPAGAALDKSDDAALQAMIQETVGQFSQLNYTEGDDTLPCNLFLPEGYPGTEKYPLVVFIADGSTVGQAIDVPLRQGYGGIIWAAAADQAKRKCIVLVPQYPQRIVDDRTGATAATYLTMTENLIRAVTEGFQVDAGRVYATGQGMGCMALMIMAEKNPTLFAGELFVAGQGDLKKIDGMKKQRFFYVVAEGDQRATAAQARLVQMFRAAGIPVTRTQEWDARQQQEVFSKALSVILAGSPMANFARFVEGTVLPVGAGANASEHEYSFDATYRIEALRDWLFLQVRK